MAYFAPALAAFAVAAFTPFPLILTVLLLGNALTLLAVSHAAGYLSGAFLSGGNNRVLEYCLLFIAYAAFGALLIGYPLHWLLRTGALPAALAVSGAIVLALIALWRVWPTLGALFVRQHACDERVPLGTTLRDAFALARAITAENDLFFSHGLPVAVSALLVSQLPLALAGVYGPLPVALRLPAFGVYALLIAPLAHWLIAARGAHAILLDSRRRRRERHQADVPEAEIAAPEPAPELAELPHETPDLNAMLLRCIRAGQTELALAALERGADPNAKPPADDRDQRPPLVLAAVSPDLRLLRGLIVKGADLNRNDGGLTPLLAATRDSLEGRPDAVMTLLTNGADPRCVDAGGNTPLHCAALASRPIVAALLCDAEAPLHAINRDGLTPLGVACAAANWELVKYLLERGAKAELEHAQPALIAAASIDDDDATGTKLLLKRKAHVNARGRLGRTALMTAALNGHVLISKALLDAGADINLADSHGATALMEAARGGAIDVLELFADHHPAPDLCDSHGRTALIIASQSKQACEETVQRLLDLGANPELPAADGKRAVDYAAAAGRWNLVARLDPNYALPANLSAPVEPSPPDAVAHLLDALRFGHWSIVDTFADRRWPSATLADLYAELLLHADPAPRAWLLRQGLDANGATSAGTPLAQLAFGRLPASLDAAWELLDAGAQVSGSDALTQVLSALGADPDARAALESLGLGLIERGVELFAADSAGRTPLARAVEAGSIDIVQALLARGADVNARDKRGCTPLFGALQLPEAPAIRLVSILLNAGADPEAAAENGETPLGLALARRCPALQDVLNWPQWKLPRRPLRGADLVAAAAAGDRAAVGKLLDLGLPLDACDAQGASALVRAAGNGHAALVRLLVARGADPGRGASTGATALSAAVSARRAEAVEALLELGVAPDQRLPGGGTCLMIAAALGYPEIAQQLLERGAGVDAEDERGVRALHAAAQFAFSSRDAERAQRTLQLLLERGAAIDAANAAGQTPLLLLLGARADPGTAVDQRQILTLLPLLLARQPNLNAQDKRGVSALHACAMHGLVLAARALLAAGADPERRDILERTPRQIAHLLGFIDVAAELGASANAIPGVSQTLRQPARGYDPV